MKDSILLKDSVIKKVIIINISCWYRFPIFYQAVGKVVKARCLGKAFFFHPGSWFLSLLYTSVLKDHGFNKNEQSQKEWQYNYSKNFRQTDFRENSCQLDLVMGAGCKGGKNYILDQKYISSISYNSCQGIILLYQQVKKFELFSSNQMSNKFKAEFK